VTRLIGAALTAALLAGVGVLPALAQSDAPAPRERRVPHGVGRPEGELWLMIRSANLTPEQQAQVRAILSTHRAGTRPLIEQLRQAQQELGARLLAAGPLQAADLQPQLQRIGQLRAQLTQDSLQAALDVRAVLTPGQLARVAQTKQRLQELRDEVRQLLEPGGREGE
jgi:Spy/CpxP family protein refolding chaperone